MSNAEELWQEYAANGTPVTTAGITKQQAREGVLHGAAHVWIWRENETGEREILLQKRAVDKPTWPGFFDISAAGHIDFGETPLEAAVRETKEELGIEISDKRLELSFVYRQLITDETSGYIENEFQWVYTCKLEAGEIIDFGNDEVDAIRWFAVTDLPKLQAGEIENVTIVPQGKTYFASLTRALSL